MNCVKHIPWPNSCFQKYYSSPYRDALVAALSKDLEEIKQEMEKLPRSQQLKRYLEARNFLCFELCANYGTRIDALYKMELNGEKSI